jgi:hypothetical protein
VLPLPEGCDQNYAEKSWLVHAISTSICGGGARKEADEEAAPAIAKMEQAVRRHEEEGGDPRWLPQSNMSEVVAHVASYASRPVGLKPRGEGHLPCHI